MDEAAYANICTWDNFPPAPDSSKWQRNDSNVIRKVYFDKLDISDRQYSRKGLIVWGHRHGVNILCTLMRQHFVPLTFDRPSARVQFNIPAKEAACA